jgi:hypothetical protein
MRPVRDRRAGSPPEPPNGPAKCRHCGRDVILARTAHNRVMRVDPRPSAVGTYVLEHDGGLYRVVHHRQLEHTPGLLWSHHLVTCPKVPPRVPHRTRRPAPVQLELGRGVR